MRYYIFKILLWDNNDRIAWLDLVLHKRYFLGLALGKKIQSGSNFLETAFGLQVHIEPTFRTNLSSLFVFLIRT